MSGVPTPVLRYGLRRWCRWVARDDALLWRHGVRGLGDEDVLIACQARGLSPTTWRRHLLAVATPTPLRALDYVTGATTRDGVAAHPPPDDTSGPDSGPDAAPEGAADVDPEVMRHRLEAWLALAADRRLSTTLLALAVPHHWSEPSTANAGRRVG